MKETREEKRMKETRERRIDRLFQERMREPGTITDALQLMVFAQAAKSSLSARERRAALRNLKSYKPDSDPFE